VIYKDHQLPVPQSYHRNDSLNKGYKEADLEEFRNDPIHQELQEAQLVADHFECDMDGVQLEVEQKYHVVILH
jgi:hypothetical protein